MGGAIGGSTRTIDEDDMARFEELQALQRKSRVPLLYRHSDHDAYVFVALFDGTGQDVADAAQRPTNVGVLKQQLDAMKKADPAGRVDGHYVRGIGTDGSALAKLRDGAMPHSWDERLEEMYQALAEKAARWKQDNPNATISVIEAGYSRGAVLGSGLAQMIDTYGIADPDGLAFGRDAQGNVTVKSPHPRWCRPAARLRCWGCSTRWRRTCRRDSMRVRRQASWRACRSWLPTSVGSAFRTNPSSPPA